MLTKTTPIYFSHPWNSVFTLQNLSFFYCEYTTQNFMDKCVEYETLSSILAENNFFILYCLYVSSINWALWIVENRTRMIYNALLLLSTLVIFIEQYRKALYELLWKEHFYSIKGTIDDIFNIETRKVHEENALESIAVPWKIRINV